jgi:predicted DNA-binding protein
MIIRIDSEIKEKVSKLARQEGKTTSQVVREMIEEYVRERDISSYVDDLWERIGKKVKARKRKIDDIEGIIKKVRTKKG